MQKLIFAKSYFSANQQNWNLNPFHAKKTAPNLQKVCAAALERLGTLPVRLCGHGEELQAVGGQVSPHEAGVPGRHRAGRLLGRYVL